MNGSQGLTGSNSEEQLWHGMDDDKKGFQIIPKINLEDQSDQGTITLRFSQLSAQF